MKLTTDVLNEAILGWLSGDHEKLIDDTDRMGKVVVDSDLLEKMIRHIAAKHDLPPEQMGSAFVMGMELGLYLGQMGVELP